MSASDHGDRDDRLRELLSRAAPEVPAVDLDADLRRGRTALGRRRSLLATLAVGAGTALVAAAAVLVPQSLGGTGAGDVPASATRTGPTTTSPVPAPDAVVPTGAPVPLVPGPAQHDDDVVATLVPDGWALVEAGPDSLVLDRDGEQLTVSPGPGLGGPPVLGGVGDFELIDGARVSYFLVDGAAGGPGRPTMVLELGFGTWAQVSASPALGWGMPELTAFAVGLRAPFACAEPCEVPLAP